MSCFRFDFVRVCVSSRHLSHARVGEAIRFDQCAEVSGVIRESEEESHGRFSSLCLDGQVVVERGGIGQTTDIQTQRQRDIRAYN